MKRMVGSRRVALLRCPLPLPHTQEHYVKAEQALGLKHASCGGSGARGNRQENTWCKVTANRATGPGPGLTRVPHLGPDLGTVRCLQELGGEVYTHCGCLCLGEPIMNEAAHQVGLAHATHTQQHDWRGSRKSPEGVTGDTLGCPARTEQCEGECWLCDAWGVGDNTMQGLVGATAAEGRREGS